MLVAGIVLGALAFGSSIDLRLTVVPAIALAALWYRQVVTTSQNRDGIASMVDSFQDLSALDLSGDSLQELDLSGRKMVGTKFSNCDLDAANLSDCDLLDARFTKAQLRATKFERSNLRDAGMYQAFAPKARFDNAQMQGLQASEATFDRAHFTNADLQVANLKGASLRHARLVDVNLAQADLTNADLRNADLSGANLTGVDLSGALLEGVRSQGAQIVDVIADPHTVHLLRLGGASQSGVAPLTQTASQTSESVDESSVIDLRAAVPRLAANSLITAACVAAVIMVASFAGSRTSVTTEVADPADLPGIQASSSVPSGSDADGSDSNDSDSDDNSSSSSDQEGAAPDGPGASSGDTVSGPSLGPSVTLVAELSPAGPTLLGPDPVSIALEQASFFASGDGVVWSVSLFDTTGDIDSSRRADAGSVYALPVHASTYFLEVTSTDGSDVTCSVAGTQVQDVTSSGSGSTICEVTPLTD